MSVELVTKNSKGSAITADEADNNFALLESQFSVEPIMQDLPSIQYLSGGNVTFTVVNFDSNAKYFVNLPTYLVEFIANNFSVIPIGDGLRLFVISEGKIVNSSFIKLYEQLLKLGIPVVFNSASNASYYLGNALCDDDGLENTLIYNANIAPYQIIGLRAVVTTTIKKILEYDNSLSTVSRLYFTLGVIAPSFIWAYFDVNETSTVFPTATMANANDPYNTDIFNDGSCVEHWTLNNTLDDVTGLNPMVLVDAVATYTFVDASYWKGIQVLTGLEASIFESTNDNSILGDTPLSLSFSTKMFVVSDLAEGIGFGLGAGAGNRYNVEFIIKTFGNDAQVSFALHKRAVYENIIFPLVDGFINIVYTYSPTNANRLYINGTLVFEDSLVMKFLALPFTLGAYGDNADPKELTESVVTQARVFNKELTVAEIAELRVEGMKYLDVTPSLAQLPTKILGGELPHTIDINGITTPQVKSLISDDGEVVKFKQTVGDDPYTTIDAIPEITVINTNSDNGFNTLIELEVDATLNKN